MIDPTISEMRQFLARECPYLDEFSTEPAIYWFASDWHGGQSTNLYAALCASEYTPGAFENACPDDSAMEAYETLREQYCEPPID